MDICEKDGELHILGTLQGVGEKGSKHGFHVHEEGDIGKSKNALIPVKKSMFKNFIFGKRQQVQGRKGPLQSRETEPWGA